MKRKSRSITTQQISRDVCSSGIEVGQNQLVTHTLLLSHKGLLANQFWYGCDRGKIHLSSCAIISFHSEHAWQRQRLSLSRRVAFYPTDLKHHDKLEQLVEETNHLVILEQLKYDWLLLWILQKRTCSSVVCVNENNKTKQKVRYPRFLLLCFPCSLTWCRSVDVDSRTRTAP